MPVPIILPDGSVAAFWVPGVGLATVHIMQLVAFMPWPKTEDATDPGVTVPWIVVVELPPRAATAAAAKIPAR